MPQYKLTYFNLRFIRGELPRWVLAAAGQTWEDVRLDYYDRTAWNALKPETPFGQIPIFETEGVTLCQSNSIARFLAKRYGLAGKTDLDQARADMVVDCVEDMSQVTVKLRFFSRTDEEKAVAKKNFEDKVPGFLERLEALLASNNGGDGYFVGDELTWADLHFTISLMYVGELDQSRYPKLAALRDRVQRYPGIAKWLRERPPAINDTDY